MLIKQTMRETVSAIIYEDNLTIQLTSEAKSVIVREMPFKYTSVVGTALKFFMQFNMEDIKINSVIEFVSRADVKAFLSKQTNRKLINDLVKANHISQKLEKLSVSKREIFHDNNN